MSKNGAPTIKWYGHTMACGTRRQRLFIEGQETPFFIDTAAYPAHKTGGKHSLYGAGMSEPHWLTKSRVAAAFGFGPKAEVLKHRAEQMALSRD